MDDLAVRQQFLGDLSAVRAVTPPAEPAVDSLDLVAMARGALNYLRGNPDPARAYECKFELGPLGIPFHQPLAVPPNQYGFDPISLGDTDCRMHTQYVHMRQMAGEEAEDVERGVARRVAGYLGSGSLAWINPAAWTGEPVEGLWISKWASAKILIRLADDYAASGDEGLRTQARAIFEALKGLAHWDGPRAYYPGGGVPVRDGDYLRQGWAAEHCKNYPFIVEPCLHYANLCGDGEALEFAVAMTEGFLAGSQPGQEYMRISPHTGSFQEHVHLHSHAFWGVAHLGAQLGEARYLDWAQRAYEWVRDHGTDYGWFPEFIPHSAHKAEICVVGDMLSTAAWLAQRHPHYYDHLERGVANLLRACQFALTPAFVALFERVHADLPAATVKEALAALRSLEGGFVAAPTPVDLVCKDDTLGQTGRSLNGIDMMGCCPPEGMRGLWEAWRWTVEERPECTRINLACSVRQAAATVTAFAPSAGRLQVEARRPGRYELRPPAWASREQVSLEVDGAAVAVQWSGPALAYVAREDVRPGQVLTLRWQPLAFTQDLVMRLVPRQHPRYTVQWLGNRVQSISPSGKYLPLFG